MENGIGNRIKEARLNLHLTQEELAKRIGVTKGAIANYEKNTSHPKEAVIYSLIEALEVDANFLFQDCVKTRPTATLTPEALRIAKQYDDLDDFGKETMEYVLSRETDRVKEIRRLNSQLKTEAAGELLYMPLPFSRQPVSAGRGAYLGPEELDTIFVEKNNLTRRASFAVKVSGDSMEPEYSDGDILLVEGADDIRVGEIGVFTMDGDGYVKERGNEELISLNSEYDPIPMNESIWCNGRVIGKLLPEWVQSV